MASTSDGTARDKVLEPGSDMSPPAQLRAVHKDDDDDDDHDDDDEGKAVAAANKSSSATRPEPTAKVVASPAPACVTGHIAVAAEPPAASPPARPSTPSPNRRPPDSIPLTRSSAEPERTHHQQPAQDPENTMSDPLAPLTPFMGSSLSNMDYPAYRFMMALASANADKRTPPPTVTPSQVTLPNPADGNHFGLIHGHGHGLGRHAAPDNGLESFSRIEFADSVFQMTTHSVIIGRDQRALEQARLDEKRALEYRRRVEDNASKGLPPPSPIRHDRCKFSKSYVSEEGGMLGPESDSEDSGRPPKRRKTSSGPSSYVSNNDDAQDSNIISDRQYVSHTPGAAAVDLTNLRPSPSHTPFIGIHSPGPDIATKTKAISREHLKIAYNEETGVFEAIPLHKNGFFCEDVHHKSDTVVLRCGDRLQIKDVGFRFIINGVERGFTGAEEFLEEEAARKQGRDANGGKEMSFDFEQSHGNGKIQYTSDELSDLVTPPQLSDFGDAAEPEQPEPEAKTEDRGKAPEPDPTALLPQPPKKRGPGRPPKNGIMSKREQRLLKKQQQLQQQEQKQLEQQQRLQQQQQDGVADEALPQAPSTEPPLKRKVGRPRKHPLPEDGGGDRPEKRRYKPRKPKNEDGAVGSDAERRAREKKDRKARPKSPPLELKMENYSEEQLQKPNKNYGILIDEALAAAGPDGLTLKQIYKRICQRYPWFHFHTETKGWESSVRHNLIGNEAFKKDESTNRWSRNHEIALDAGKKRKVASPERVLAGQQAYGSYAFTYGGGGGGAQQQMPTSGYAPGYHPTPGFPTQPTQPPALPSALPPSAPPNGPMNQQLMARPTGPSPQVHVYVAPPARTTAVAGAQPGGYSSPYIPRPPALAPTPVKAENGATTGAPLAPAVPSSAQADDAVQKATAAQPLTTTTPSTPAAPVRPVANQRLLQAVVKLKNGLISNFERANNPQAEAIVMSALNRVIGLKQGPGSNDNLEKVCMHAINQVIEGYLVKNRSSEPAGASSSSSSTSSPATPDPPTMLDPQVLKSLNGFKAVSIRALKGRLGEARAEDMALSAIDRVLGLSDTSSFASTGQQSNGSFDGVEQHLMKSVRQLLIGMNQQLPRSQDAPPPAPPPAPAPPPPPPPPPPQQAGN
ncbi:hypothetical protein CP533_5143 [Ophiocordyceps camponoti-saundersi (nom. inval.)]|nr:hypothetical protein CP533_5143 [Ophiocordyceps camponoti-saundersi (nom. inval.)]